MAINRYDVPAQDNYKNTYVPLPYEQIMNTVAARQAQAMREQDMLNKTYEDTQNLTYIPGTQDEGYIRDYVGKASELVNKYISQDLSNPIVKAQMRREFSGMTDRQTIQNIQSSHTAWATNQKYKGQLKAEGLYDSAIDEDPANSSFSSKNGVYGYISPSYKNPRPAAETYFNNIKASDLGTDKAGDYFYQGVSRTKINEVAEQKWGEFVNTSEGNLYVKKIAKERGLDYTNQKVRRDIGTEYLKGVGEEFIYRDRAGATLEGQVRAARGKKDSGDEEPFGLTRKTQNDRVTDNFDPLKVGKLNFGKDGKFIPDPVSGEHMTGIPGFTPGKFSGEILTEEQKQKRGSEANAKLAAVREKLPQLKGLSDAETYKAYRELTKDGRAFPDLDLVEVPGVPRENLASYLGSGLLDRKIMIMDQFGESDLRDVSDTSQNSPLQDAGYTTQTLKHELMLAARNDPKAKVTIGGMAQSGPMSGMVQLELLDKSRKGGSKGKTRKLYISTNNTFKDILAPTNDVYNNIRGFQGGTTILGNDAEHRTIAVKVTPSIQKDPTTGKWIYDYDLKQGYLTPDGNVATDDIDYPNGIPTSIDEIGDMQLNRLYNSKKINSQLNFTRKTAPSFN